MAITRLSTPILFANLAVFIVIMNGCGGDASDAVARVAGVQPRCKTPQDVLDKFNQAHANELVDVNGVFALLYAENELQTDILATLRNAMPLYELDAAMRAEYGTPLERCPMDTIFAALMDPAKLKDSEDSRATATFIDHNGAIKTLQLTRQGSAWFLSAFTLEYDDRIKQAFETGTLLASNSAFSRIHLKVPSLISRLRAGEFHSATAAKKAILDAAQHP